MDILLTLLFMLILLLLKGFFSGSEIALVSTDRHKLRHKAAQGSKGAKLAFNMLAIPERLLATTLLGTNISSVALTTIGTVLMVKLFGGSGELIAVIVFTPIFLIFGEIIPKAIYQHKAETLSPIIIYPLSWLQSVLMPVIWVLSKIAALVASLLGKGEDPGDTEREGVMAMVNMAESSGGIAAFERGQVRRVLQFAQMTAGEVMIPLSEMMVLSENSKMSKLMATRKRTGQRLIPLYTNSPSDITAVVRLGVWDVLDENLSKKTVDEFKCRVVFVPTLQRVSESIETLSKDPNAIIVVVDDIGQSLGIITLHNLVRLTLDGSKSEKQGKSTNLIHRDENGAYILDARLPIANINDTLGIHLPVLTRGTLGGYALTQFRHIPEVGETFVSEGYTFTVSKASPKAILELKAKRSQ